MCPIGQGRGGERAQRIGWTLGGLPEKGMTPGVLVGRKKIRGIPSEPQKESYETKHCSLPKRGLTEAAAHPGVPYVSDRIPCTCHAMSSPIS